MKIIIITVFLIGAFLFVGCKKTSTTETSAQSTPSIPFQGPKNSSFETISSNWVLQNNTGGNLSYMTGTSFMPSNGVEYMNMTFQAAWSGNPSQEIYQDAVDLTHSSTMTFDYTLDYTPWTGAHHESATVKILFTSNGTVTLWQQTIDSTSTLPIQILNKTITLPSTSSSGRLIIQASTAATLKSGYGYNTIGTFNIDNIRVH